MKYHFFTFILFIFLVGLTACDDSGRPKTEEFSFKITGHSILKNAEVSILDGDGKEIKTGTTDENGEFIIEDVESATSLLVKVCKGSFLNASLESDVDFSGCLENSIAVSDGDISLSVNFLTTFISKYDSTEDIEEWKSYLDITTLPVPEMQSSLTDSTKVYLFHQGLMKIAENVSIAGTKTPETTYSTETLLNLLLEDLADDDIINGSTAKKFGGLNVNADIMKGVLADVIPEISGSFTAEDLNTWLDTLRYSNAKFLGGSGGEIDKSKPVITITTPENNAIIYGMVEIEAVATDNEQVQSLTCAIVENTVNDESLEIEDEDDTPETFSSSFNSALFDDSTITLRCTASDGNNVSEAEIKLAVSNNNKVSLSAFITNALTDWDKVTIYRILENGTTDTKVKTLESDDLEEVEEGKPIETLLAPGEYRFVFKGGSYIPVFLGESDNPDENRITFDSSLETRGTVKVGEDTTIIATPLTTLREYLFAAFVDDGTYKVSECDSKSFDLISEHIDSDFPIYQEPISKPQLTENSKYYIALASLERLAVLVGERHDPPLEAGAITVEQVLKALTDDLDSATKAVLDGVGTINQFPVDSYLFRYWYAIAMKLYLESEKNNTTLGFSDLQTVINNISMDDSELFPDDAEPRRVTDQPPVISDKMFKRSFETEFQNYSVENIIYSNNSVFNVYFKALPDSTGDLFLDSVEITGDVEVQSISDINDEGEYTAEVQFPTTEDGNKSILITAIDNAENTGTATLQAVKDTVSPVVVNLGNSLATNVTTPLAVPYEVTETNPLDTLFAVTASGEFPGSPSDWTSLDPALVSGDITVTDSMLTDDGAYTLHFKTVDKAGNEASKTKALIFDRIKPTATFTTVPEINENGFIQEESIVITIIATDNVTPETDLIHEYWNGTSWIGNVNETKHIWNLFSFTEQVYNEKFRVRDLADNRSDDITVSFTVDLNDPVLATNKTDLESRAYNISDVALVLNATCTDSNLDSFTYSINGSEPVSVPGMSTALTNHPDLKELENGEANTVTVTCTDLSGRMEEETISILIDNTPARVETVVNHPGTGGTVPVCSLAKTIQLVTVDDHSKPVQIKYSYHIGEYSESNVFTAPVIEATGGTSLTVPNVTDNYYNTLTLSKDNFNVVVSVIVIDDAGNESTPYPISWNLDKKPPIYSLINLASFGFGLVNPEADNIDFDEYLDKYNQGGEVFEAYFDNLISESGLEEIVNLQGYINESLLHDYTFLDATQEGIQPGECIKTVCSNSDTFKPCLWCVMDEQGAVFNFKTTLVDSCANSGVITDCKSSDYSCLEGHLNPSTPEVYVSAVQTSTNSYNIEILSQGANVESCHIMQGSTVVDTCNNAIGVQQYDASGLSDGLYTVRATVKYPDGTNYGYGYADFLVDRTVFNVTIDVDLSKIHYLSFPAINYTAQIASGVKSVKIYLKNHYKNTYYVSVSENLQYNCDSSGRCSSTTARKLVGESSNSSGSILPQKSGGYYNIDGGFWNTVEVVVTPNFGADQTKEFAIGSGWGGGIQFIRTPSQDTHMQIIGDTVYIYQSIIDKDCHTSYVSLRNVELPDRVCQNPNTKVWHYASWMHTQYSAELRSISGSQHYYKGTIRKMGAYRWNWKAGRDCTKDVDCPSTAESCHVMTGECIVDKELHELTNEYPDVDCYNDIPYNNGCTWEKEIWYHSDQTYIDVNALTRSKDFYLKDYILTYSKEEACNPEAYTPPFE